jgi:hypothetical protein
VARYEGVGFVGPPGQPDNPSSVITLTRAILVGEFLVVGAASRSGNDAGLTDVSGNVWSSVFPGPIQGSSGGVEVATRIYYTVVTTQIPAGNSITITNADGLGRALGAAMVIPGATGTILGTGQYNVSGLTTWAVPSPVAGGPFSVAVSFGSFNPTTNGSSVLHNAPYTEVYDIDASGSAGQIGGSFAVAVDQTENANSGTYEGGATASTQAWGVAVFEDVEPPPAPPLGAYKDEVLADTPIGYYRCDDASGNPQDSSGNGKNANSVSGTLQYKQPTLIRSDPASYATDYLDATVNVPGLPLIGNVFSLELWLKKGTSGSYKEIFQKGNTDGFTFRFMPDGKVQLVRSGLVNIGNSSVSVTDAETHHVVCTRAGGGAGQTKIYVDGVDVSASMATGDITAQNIDLSIGRGGIDATFDELALYDYALSAERVLAHYNAGLIIAPSLTTPPVLFGEPVWNGKLAVSNGEWAGTAPITFTYEWERSPDGIQGWVPIAGATNSSYLQTQDDVGQFIRCVVTATNVGGSPFAPSNSAGPVVDGKETWVHLESRVNYPPASSWTQIKAGAVYPGGNTSWVEVEAAIGEGGGEEVTSYGTTLPGAPADGDTHILVDSLTAATYQWEFRYNAARATNKWEFVGGSPIISEVADAEAVNGTTYVALATAGPSITVPVAGVYQVEIGCKISPWTSSIRHMSYDIGVTGAVDTDSIYFLTGPTSGDPSSSLHGLRKQTLAAGTALVSKYKSSVGNPTFGQRYMKVTPLAVGG